MAEASTQIEQGRTLRFSNHSTCHPQTQPSPVVSTEARRLLRMTSLILTSAIDVGSWAGFSAWCHTLLLTTTSSRLRCLLQASVRQLATTLKGFWPKSSRVITSPRPGLQPAERSPTKVGWLSSFRLEPESTCTLTKVARQELTCPVCFFWSLSDGCFTSRFEGSAQALRAWRVSTLPEASRKKAKASARHPGSRNDLRFDLFSRVFVTRSASTN